MQSAKNIPRLNASCQRLFPGRRALQARLRRPRSVCASVLHGGQELALDWSEQERDAATKTGLGIDRTLELADDVKKMRLVILDRRSLALGSVDIPIVQTRNTPAQ